MTLNLRESLRRVARESYAEIKHAGAALPRQYVTHISYDVKRDNPPTPIRAGGEDNKALKSVGYPT